jgi:hypothetical protein
MAPPVIFDPKDAKRDKLYFIKHRYGAQGKSVYVYDKQELEQWWKTSKNTNDFVIQQEVRPALDPNGRKFVLRNHILVFQKHGGPMQAFIHKDIICLPHASQSNSSHHHSQLPKSAFVSQARRQHPKPSLLHELEPLHPAANLWPQIRLLAWKLVSLATTSTTLTMYAENPFQQPIGEGTTCFALLGADLLVSEAGAVKICEVNSHPALGWGTMKQVPSKVFQRLIEDTLVVLIGDETLQYEGNRFERL